MGASVSRLMGKLPLMSKPPIGLVFPPNGEALRGTGVKAGARKGRRPAASLDAGELSAHD